MHKRSRQLFIIALFMAFGISFPYLASLWGMDYLTGIASRMLIYGIAATSLGFILGQGGMVSFGHAAFLGVGAYTGAILVHSGWSSALLIWPMAILWSALVALIIGIIVIRTKGVYFIMITLAFAQMLYFLAISIKAYGGDEGINVSRVSIPGLALGDDTQLYYVVFLLTSIVIFLLHKVVNSRFGRVLNAIAENEDRMQSLGYNTSRYRLVAFVFSGAVAGLAGALLVTQNSFVSPSVMHWMSSGLLLFMVILGGMKSKYGGLVGAIAFLGLEDFAVSVRIDWLADLYPNYSQHSLLLVGIVLLVVVLLAPQGIAGLFSKRTRNDGK